MSRWRAFGRSFLLPALVLLIAVPTLVLLLGFLYVAWTWDAKIDADIPPAQARDDLVRWLGDYGVESGPVGAVLAAHEKKLGGLRGGWSLWCLARLDPARAAGFESDFLAALRNSPGRPDVKRVDYLPGDLASDRSLGLERLPPGARAYLIRPPSSSCVIFMDDRLLVYFESF